MSRRRPSVANLFPPSQPEPRSNSAGPSPAATALGPPVRRVSTAVAPLSVRGKEEKKGSHSSRIQQHMEKPTLPQSVNWLKPPDIQISEADDGSGSRGKLPGGLSKSEVATVLNERRRTSDGVQQVKAKPIKEDEVRKIHSSLRASYEGKRPFEMSYKQRTKTAGDSIKSRDSGVSTLHGIFDYDDASREQWTPRWCKKKAGSAAGEIKEIKGLCFMENGNLAVSEEKNSRIQIFDKKRGQLVTVLEETGTARRMRPAGICQLPERQFLAVADQNRIVYFEPSPDGVRAPKVLDKQVQLHGIAVNSREHLILTDIGKKRVYTYDVEGKNILKFKPVDFLRPSYVTVCEEFSMVFVSDSEQGCVYMLDMNGELLNKIGKQGSDQQRLIYPLGVCCLQNGRLVVADHAQHCLFTYDFRARCYDQSLTQEDYLRSPTCVASDGRRYLAVSEENHDFKLDEYALKMFKCETSQ